MMNNKVYILQNIKYKQNKGTYLIIIYQNNKYNKEKHYVTGKIYSKRFRR